MVTSLSTLHRTGTAAMPAALNGADAARDRAKRGFNISHSPTDAYATVQDALRAADTDRTLNRGALTGSAMLWHERLGTDEAGQPVDRMKPEPTHYNLIQRAVDDFFTADALGYAATHNALGTVAQKRVSLLRISEKISQHPNKLGTFAEMVSDYLKFADSENVFDQELCATLGKNLRGHFDTVELKDGLSYYVVANHPYNNDGEMAVALVGLNGVPLAPVFDGNSYRVMQWPSDQIVGDTLQFTFKLLRSDGGIESIPAPLNRLRLFEHNDIVYSVLPGGRAVELPRSTSELTAVSAATGQKCFMHESADGVFYAVTFDESGKPCELSNRETHIIQNGLVWQKQKDGSFKMADKGTLVTNRELIQFQEGRVTQRITQANARVRILAYYGSGGDHVVFTTDVYFSDEKGKVLAYKDPTSGKWKSMKFDGYHSVSLGSLEFTDGRQVPTNGFFKHDEITNTWAFVEYVDV